MLYNRELYVVEYFFIWLMYDIMGIINIWKYVLKYFLIDFKFIFGSVWCLLFFDSLICI